MHRRAFLAASATAMGAAGAVRADDRPPPPGAPFTPLPAPERPQAVAERLGLVEAGIAAGPFAAEWDSLLNFRAPDWYRDAKFGVFIHWGVYSVPAFGDEWYPRNMYLKGRPEYEFHRTAFGPQERFGYKDFIPRFKAERFDPDAWAELFRRAGARYVVPVGEHCDGFPMYESAITGWNAARMGPRRDVIGEVARAVRARGLHFGLSSHRAEHWWWYDGGRKYACDVNDPRFAGLYGDAAPRVLPADPDKGDPDPVHLERWYPPSRAFLEDWLARTSEAADRYKPEFIYLDWWINHPSFEPYLRRFAAYYYNNARAAGHAPVLAYKEEAFPPGAALLDVERGRLDQLRLTPWQSDTSVSIASWGYVRDDTYKTPKELLQVLADVVSKNGCMLLNVGPRADGTIPDEARTALLAMGDWLRVNGEAIYGSRPWKLYGEGASALPTGSLKEKETPPPTREDIRFTTRAGRLYAIGLERPKDGVVLIKTLFDRTTYLDAPVREVWLLGQAAPLRFAQGARGLVVQLPPARDDLPYVLRIA